MALLKKTLVFDLSKPNALLPTSLSTSLLDAFSASPGRPIHFYPSYLVNLVIVIITSPPHSWMSSQSQGGGSSQGRCSEPGLDLPLRHMLTSFVKSTRTASDKVKGEGGGGLRDWALWYQRQASARLSIDAVLRRGHQAAAARGAIIQSLEGMVGGGARFHDVIIGYIYVLSNAGGNVNLSVCTLQVWPPPLSVPLFVPYVTPSPHDLLYLPEPLLPCP